MACEGRRNGSPDHENETGPIQKNSGLRRIRQTQDYRQHKKHDAGYKSYECTKRHALFANATASTPTLIAISAT